jgi:hypothetical protein
MGGLYSYLVPIWFLLDTHSAPTRFLLGSYSVFTRFQRVPMASGYLSVASSSRIWRTRRLARLLKPQKLLDWKRDHSITLYGTYCTEITFPIEHWTHWTSDPEHQGWTTGGIFTPRELWTVGTVYRMILKHQCLWMPSKMPTEGTEMLCLHPLNRLSRLRRGTCGGNTG